MKPSADESKTQAIPSPATSEDRPKEDAASPKKETKMKKSDRPSSSPLLWFIGAFFGGLVLFSVIAYFLLPVFGVSFPFGSSAEPTVATQSTAPTQPTARYNHTDRLSAAVYITDNKDQLQSATIVMIQPDTMEISVLGLPAQLKISNDGPADTLYNRFASGRAQSAQMALMTYFGKSIDYHFTLSYDDADVLFRALRQPLIFNLPTDVNEQSADNQFSIHLTAGEQALTPAQTANLLQYDNWQGGLSERAQIHATMISTFLAQYITPSRDIADDYDTLRHHADCNLSGERFRVLEPTLKDMAQKYTQVRHVIHYTEGTYEGAGNALCFTPGSQSIDSVKATLN